MKFQIYHYPVSRGPKWGWELVNNAGKSIAQCVDLYLTRSRCVTAIAVIQENMNKEVKIVDRDPGKNCIE